MNADDGSNEDKIGKVTGKIVRRIRLPHSFGFIRVIRVYLRLVVFLHNFYCVAEQTASGADRDLATRDTPWQPNFNSATIGLT